MFKTGSAVVFTLTTVDACKDCRGIQAQWLAEEADDLRRDGSLRCAEAPSAS
jgi:hypothetical protein